MSSTPIIAPETGKSGPRRPLAPTVDGAGRLRPRVMRGFAIIAGLIALAPVLAVIASVFEGAGDAQAHIWSTAGPGYLIGTLTLCACVGVGTVVVGAGAACLVSCTDFRGRRFFSVALALPLAAPAYIVAYVYGDATAPFSPLSNLLSSVGLGAPDVRTIWGAAAILTLMTYPYVYLAARATLAARSGRLMEAARATGANPTRALWRIILPATRPAIAGGAALAMMETAGDFGVADYFGVPTLSTGIFRTWYGAGDLTAALQLAAGLFLIALMLVLLEEGARKGRVDDGARGGAKPGARIALSPLASLSAATLCALPVFFGFVAPVALLLLMASGGGADLDGALSALFNTFSVAAIATSIAIAAAVGLAYAARSSGGALTRFGLRAATLGYALPGALIAIGALKAVLSLPGDIGASGIVATGAALLIYVYVLRFLTVGYNYAAGGLAQISPAMDDAARTLGRGPTGVVAYVHAPIAARAFLAGALVVFIDVAKELPATLILRPFNFETLATRTYRLATDERLREAAPDALALIALGALPVIVLALTTLGGRQNGSASAE